MIVHSASHEFKELLAQLIVLLKDLGATPCDFLFSTLQILDNAQISSHVDKNIGESLIVALGDYTGGELIIGDAPYNICEAPLIFDGQTVHEVAPFSGDRWSITLYFHNRAAEISGSDLAFLVGTGFQFPVAETLGLQLIMGPSPTDASSATPMEGERWVLFEIDATFNVFAAELASRDYLFDHFTVERNTDALSCNRKLRQQAKHYSDLRQAFADWEVFMGNTKAKLNIMVCGQCRGSSFDADFLGFINDILKCVRRQKSHNVHYIFFSDVVPEVTFTPLSDILGAYPFKLLWNDFSCCKGESLVWCGPDLAWPKGARQPNVKQGCPVVRPPSRAVSRDKLGDFLLDGWYSDHQSSVSISSLLTNETCREAVWKQNAWSVSPPRNLWTVEAERALGLAPESSNGVQKEQGQKLPAREARRHALLGVTLPRWMVAFACTATLASSSVADPLETFPSHCRAVLEDLRSQCPFTAFASEQGLDTGSQLRADPLEITPASISFLAAKAQDRKTAGSSAPCKAVPSGLSEFDHFLAGLSPPSPLDGDAGIPLDMQFAVQKLADARHCIDAWREQQFAKIVAAFEGLQKWRAELEAARGASSKICSGHIDAAINGALAYSILWPDLKVQDLITYGVLPMGPQTPTGIYRKKVVESTLSFDDFHAMNAAFRESMRSRAPPPRAGPGYLCEV